MLMKLANQVPAMILRSPVHGMLSSRYLVLEFTGRKSGRRFRTPVAYIRDGKRILLTTDSPWWRNITTPAPVRLWLRGPSRRDPVARHVRLIKLGPRRQRWP